MIDRHSALSLRRQAQLLQVSRSCLYYRQTEESASTRALKKEMDRLHHEDPTAGSRRMQAQVLMRGFGTISRNRIRRLMRRMGIEAVYPRKRTTIPGRREGIRPYLLKGVTISRPNQVWCADITHIPMKRGSMFLVCVMDWYSRNILAWELSNTMDTGFCMRVMKAAVNRAGCKPEIMNTEQGSQFTSCEWLSYLEKELKVRVSMDGRGRWLDNVMIERFWRSIKYEDIYLNVYEDGHALQTGIGKFIHRYSHLRPHSSLGNKTPAMAYSERANVA